MNGARRRRGTAGTPPVPVDELVRQSGLPSGAVQLVLLELDLAGRLDRHAGECSLRPLDSRRLLWHVTL